MNFARKVMLISPETLERLKNFQSPSYSHSSCPLDSEMHSILNEKNTTDDIKWRKYEQLLQKYLRLKAKSKVPISIPIVSEQNNANQYDQKRNEDSFISMKKQGSANSNPSLANFLSTQKLITWDENGLVSIRGQKILGSNIYNLIKDVGTSRKLSTSPGWEVFARALAELNIPRDFIPNNSRWYFIQNFKRDKVATKRKISGDQIWPLDNFYTEPSKVHRKNINSYSEYYNSNLNERHQEADIDIESSDTQDNYSIESENNSDSASDSDDYNSIVENNNSRKRKEREDSQDNNLKNKKPKLLKKFPLRILESRDPEKRKASENNPYHRFDPLKRSRRTQSEGVAYTLRPRKRRVDEVLIQNTTPDLRYNPSKRNRRTINDGVAYTLRPRKRRINAVTTNDTSCIPEKVPRSSRNSQRGFGGWKNFYF
jgi:hypothetical protein